MTLTKRQARLVAATGACALFCVQAAQAVTTVFFYTSQTATVVATNMASTTISSSGYLLAYSLDNWWYPTISIGPGIPTGRFTSVNWPTGVQAQTITAGPTGSLASQISAAITIKRVDGLPFDLTSFTANILGNTGGAGAAFEIMPQLNGQDGIANPLTLDATGIAGNAFSYSTPTLTGFDTYTISLWMDFALTGLTLVDASSPVPVTLSFSNTSSNSVRLSWPTQAVNYSLQSSPDLAPAHFTDTGVAPLTEGANQVVTLPKTNSHRFFRLAQ